METNKVITRKGITLSPALVALYVLGTIVLATAVGVIVYFAHPARRYSNSIEACHCEETSSRRPGNPTSGETENVTWTMCIDLARKLNQCLPPELCQTTTEVSVEPRSPRLPDSLKPYHYNVEIKPNIYGNDSTLFKFQGWVEIYLTCVKPSDSIVLHYKQLFLEDKVLVNKQDTNTELIVSGTSKDDKTDQFTISLSETLAAGDEVLVKLSFYGPIYRNLVGLYLADYTEDGQTKYMVSTQFQPSYARQTFPCMDEPGLKATFNISVWRKEPMIAITNMPKYTSETRENGWVIDHFSETPVAMPTYLVAIAVADFDMVETFTQNNKMVRFFGRPDHIENDLASLASDTVAPMLDYYQEYFDHEYDFPKSDQIAVPAHLAAAMENWGLVTYLEPLLMVDMRYTSAFDLWRAIKVIAHELVHQWIGNAVTVSWWDDLWIQEGLTTYYESRGVHHVRPGWNLTMYDHAYYLYAALDSDQSGSSNPLYMAVVNHNYAIEDLFSLLTYYKGFAIFMMIEMYVFRDAPEVFHRSVVEFVEQYSNSTYEHDDLLRILQKNADTAGVGINITEMVYTWITQMGYPLVTFRRSGDGKRVHVTQSMFLIDVERPIDNSHPSPYGYTWEVPLSYYTTKERTVHYDWLHKNNKTINLNSPLNDGDWIIGNYRHLGYYRVNYDDITWAAIINQLKSNHEVIDVLQRGQLLDDAFDLGRALQADQTHALRLSEYLISEEEFLPWFAFISGIKYTDDILSTSGHYGHLKMYVDKISTPILGKLGWKPTENLLDSFLRERIIHLACTFGNIECIRKSVQLFDEWMRNPSNVTIVDATYRSPVYCTAIQNAYSSTQWSFLFKHYTTLEHDFERWMVRDALACSSERWILKRYFEMGASNNVSIQSTDHAYVMLAVAKNYPLGHSVAFEYLNQHWEDMSGVKSLILRDLIKRYSTEADLQKFETFVKEHPPTSEREKTSYDNMRYTITANNRWRNVNYAKVINWLQGATA